MARIVRANRPRRVTVSAKPSEPEATAIEEPTFVTESERWGWAGVPSQPAATYANGEWYGVLEYGIDGIAPVVLTKTKYSNHSAAFAHAKDTLDQMIQAAEEVLKTKQPYTVQK